MLTKMVQAVRIMNTYTHMCNFCTLLFSLNGFYFLDLTFSIFKTWMSVCLSRCSLSYAFSPIELGNSVFNIAAPH